MKKTKYPKYIERVSDGELFSLNEDGKTYSLEMIKKDFPKSLYNKYSYSLLMKTHGNFFRHYEKK